MAMSTRTVNGTTLSYQERGTGRPALVLLHGFPLDWRVWDAQVTALSDRHRVIAPDLRGFGKSPSTTSITMESIADDVHALLESLGALPMIVGGLSMGGYAALAYARKYPQDLKGLVLVDTRSGADTPEGKQGRQKMIELVNAHGATAVADQMFPKMLAPDSATKRPGVAKRLRDIMENAPPKTIATALAAMRDRPDYTGDLKNIKVPTLIIVGEHDAITPPPMAEAMHREIAGSQLVLVKGAGHMTPMEQPEQVNEALRKFVGSI
jgi:3-oxoadipate enol-lactonase